jgi:hypothetical protein
MMKVAMNPDELKVGVTVVLRDGSLGVIAKLIPAAGTEDPDQAQIKLRDEGQTVIIATSEIVETRPPGAAKPSSA